MAFFQSLEGVGGGKVIQVVNAQQTSSYTTTSSTLSTVLALTCTPTSTSNKLKIEVNHMYIYPDGSFNHGWCTTKMQRPDGTNIGWSEYYLGDDNPQLGCQQCLGFTFMDTIPAATEVTYYYKTISHYGLALTLKNTEITLTEYVP